MKTLVKVTGNMPADVSAALWRIIVEHYLMLEKVSQNKSIKIIQNSKK
jgi:hypothetical protein